MDGVSWGPNAQALLALAAYLALGLAVGATLARRGFPGGTAAAAIAVWPMFVPLLGAAPAPVRAGPFASRIDAVFGAVRQVLAETGTTEIGTEDLDRLQAALGRADERIAVVDGLLARPIDASHPARSLTRLTEARAHAAAEVEAVIAELAELRLQVGLLTLAGGGSVRAQLNQLQARVASLEEVARVG
ncbi:MAG: hypothetical protein ABMA64_29970 [Myxococcota bacterium]